MGLLTPADTAQLAADLMGRNPQAAQKLKEEGSCDVSVVGQFESLVAVLCCGVVRGLPIASLNSGRNLVKRSVQCDQDWLRLLSCAGMRNFSCGRVQFDETARLANARINHKSRLTARNEVWSFVCVPIVN